MISALKFKHSGEPYYLKNLVNLFCYSYSELRQAKSDIPYSRLGIHELMRKRKGNKTNLELEDFLRNDLVKNYIEKNKKMFNLDYFLFILGVEELDGNISTGNLDIKIMIPSNFSLSSSNYLVCECKRINKLKKTKDYYIKGGIERFVNRKYYPNQNINLSIMIGFNESESTSSYENVENIVYSLNELIKDKNYTKKQLKDSNSRFNNGVEGADVFDSVFNRIDDNEIKILHLFLDYNSIISN